MQALGIKPSLCFLDIFQCFIISYITEFSGLHYPQFELEIFRSIIEEFSDDLCNKLLQYANIRRSTIHKDPKNTGWALCPVHAYIKRANDAQVIHQSIYGLFFALQSYINLLFLCKKDRRKM